LLQSARVFNAHSCGPVRRAKGRDGRSHWHDQLSGLNAVP
jgi:hypothetical protein